MVLVSSNFILTLLFFEDKSFASNLCLYSRNKLLYMILKYFKSKYYKTMNKIIVIIVS